MLVLVCGGRDYTDRAALKSVLDAIHEDQGIEVLITGAASGADYLAETWARTARVPYVGHPAKWEQLGKKAGIIRNNEMLFRWKPDLVVAFPGGKGTTHMVASARSLNVEVIEVQQ